MCACRQDVKYDGSCLMLNCFSSGCQKRYSHLVCAVLPIVTLAMLNIVLLA